jgi:SWIM zinc finger
MITSEQILALAPDDASAKAAKGLMIPEKWPALGFNEEAIWGECQGSGAKPYQACIALLGPTFKCTCPSRKFPCKHGLALFLLRAQREGEFKSKAAPPWVVDWLASRRDQAEKKSVKQASQGESQAATPADPEAAAQREAKRLERMISGASDLQRWLADLVQHGLSDLSSKPTSLWRDAAARLVDAQASGLAGAVLRLEGVVHSGLGWPERLLAQMGRLHLLVDALQRSETLPAGLRAEVRSTCGWPLESSEVLASGERVTDTWLIQGQSFEQNDRLWERRVWLRGRESARQALLLDFSHGQRRFEQGFVTGSCCEAALAFFPAGYPLRALIVDGPQNVAASWRTDIAGAISWRAALGDFANALAGNPWLARAPLGLSEVVPLMRDNRWLARDAENREVPLRVANDDAWELTALSGGRPLTMFGEWNGEQWRPLTAWSQDGAKVEWLESGAN